MILEEEPTGTFIILGGGDEDLKSAETFKSALNEKFHDRIIDLTNKLNYRQSGVVLNFCDMYIGNITGTMHMAAAVNCPVILLSPFPADLPQNPGDDPLAYYPYGVSSIWIHPPQALPECAEADYDIQAYGCAVMNEPHCITQIEPETILRAFYLLKERIAKNLNTPLYIC